MKINKILLCASLAGLTLGGCTYDDSEAKRSLGDLEKRMTNVEQEVNKLNSSMTNLKALVDAVQNKVTISSVKTTDEGCIIVFSNGTTATILNGKNGGIPYIGGNGNWWIDNTDLGVRGLGKDGQNGADGSVPTIGANGNWWIDYKDTGISAGSEGLTMDGLVPYVGENGNWWVGQTDTGYKAVGKDGKDGKDGVDGQIPYVGENGNWWIGQTDTGFKAVDQMDNYPVVTILEQSGVYYWALAMNGKVELLYGPDGQPIPVVNQFNIVPIVHVTTSGFWELSFDNGATWNYLVDDFGQKYIFQFWGSSTPSCNCPVGSVSVTDQGLVIVLNTGEVITIPFSYDGTGIPAESLAEPCPYNVNPSETNVTVPNFSVYTYPSNNKVLAISFTGIRTYSGDYMTFHGTGMDDQNIWVEIDDTPVSFKVIEADDNRIQAKADVVFLVDNSGSMSEEADYVAQEINNWSKELNKYMDVQFGLVASEGKYVNGASDIADVSQLSNLLNRGVTGTSRTMTFYGSNSSTLSSAAGNSKYRNNDWYESGGMLLRFADEQFHFRSGANRTYVGFTDEPNQPGGQTSFSVETFNPASSQYNWSAARGTVHYIFSDNSGSYDKMWYPAVSSKLYNLENPMLFAKYTGGTYSVCRNDFRDFDWKTVAVTGAIEHSFILGIRNTTKLSSGSHKVTITIYDGQGNKGKIVYQNVVFI